MPSVKPSSSGKRQVRESAESTERSVRFRFGGILKRWRPSSLEVDSLQYEKSCLEGKFSGLGH